MAVDLSENTIRAIDLSENTIWGLGRSESRHYWGHRMPIARRLFDGTLLGRRRTRPRARRPSAAARGYGASWRLERAAHLEHEPACASCGIVRADNHVDHIERLRDGGRRLQTLCASCHGQKTARQDGGYGNARR